MAEISIGSYFVDFYFIGTIGIGICYGFHVSVRDSDSGF